MPEQDAACDYDVFISYSHLDQDWVSNWLVPRLQAAGVRVCIDRESFAVGAVVVESMEQGVERSRKILPVLTPNWTKSDWSNFEVLVRATDDPLNRLRRILPLMLKKCEPPKRISILNYADFTQSGEWEREFARLVKAINDKGDRKPLIEMAGLSSPFILPQVDDANFTGREDELRQLEDLLLRRDGAKVCSIVGLAGTGGIGKSALACHFAELHRDDFPAGVIGLRVDGKDPDAIAREFARSCKEELDPDDDRAATVIMQEVFRHRRALLIFDNAEDVNIRSLLPGGDRCAVIVTTRDRGLPVQLGIPAQGRLDLSPLPKSASFKLLRRLIGDARIAAERRATMEIIELVGRLPLALQIVGANLQVCDWLSLTEYAASLREERLAILSVRGAEHLGVRASFSLSLKFLEPDEVVFFACLCVCAQDGFSIESAMAAGNCERPMAHKRLGYLYRLSLLNRPQFGTNRFVFHPLIHRFAKDLASERGLLAAAEAHHADYYIKLVRSSDLDDPSLASLASFVAGELDDIVIAAEWLQRQNIADDEIAYRLQPFFQRAGYWQKAIQLIAGFLAVAERTEDWRAIAQLRIQQAKYLSLRGDLTGAEQILSPLADIISKIEAQKVRQPCETMWLTTLGTILQRQGHFDEAVTAFQRSAAIEEQLGREHGQAKVWNSLGAVLQRMGRFDEALDVFQRSYDLLVKVNDQRGQAMALTSLGGLFQRLGRFDEAVKAFQSSAAIEESRNSKRGQAIVLNSLGGVLQRQGHFDEAVDVLKRCAAIEEELGNQRGQAMVLNSLGGVLQRQGKFDESVAAFQRSYAISEELGDQRSLAMVLNSLGGVLQRQGKLDEAMKALEFSYTISEQMGHQQSMAMRLNSLGGVLQRQGKFDEAVEAFQRSYAISEELSDQRSLAMVLNSLGGVLQRQGRFDESVAAFQRSAQIGEELGDHRHLAMVLNSLGGVLRRQGQFDESVEVFQRSYKLLVKLDDQRGQAMALNSLGGVLQRQGKFDESVKAFRRSAQIGEELGDHRHLAMVLNSLGGVLQRQGRFDEAVDVLQRCVAIEEELGNQRGQAMVYTSMGSVLFSHGDIENAITEFRKGFEIDEKLGNKRGISIVAPSLIKALVNADRLDEASSYYQRAIALVPNDKRLLQLRPQLSLRQPVGNSSIVCGRIKCIISSSMYRYGFIIPDSGAADIYFHQKDIDPDCFAKLAAGVRVEAEVVPETKGLRAITLKLID